MINFFRNWLIFTKKILLIILLTLMGLVVFPFFERKSSKIEADLDKYSIKQDKPSSFVFFQENTLVQVPEFYSQERPRNQKIKVVMTAYSSTPWETDDTPHITAYGTYTREGIVANNFLPFGTKIKIPEIFGEKIFFVEDKMHWKASNYHIDVWFPDYYQALNFGKKITYIEILQE